MSCKHGFWYECDLCAAEMAKYNSGFQAGAASRDADIHRLQMALADTEALEAVTAEKCDQLREQVAMLQINLRRASNYVDSLGGDSQQYRQVLAAT